MIRKLTVLAALAMPACIIGFACSTVETVNPAPRPTGASSSGSSTSTSTSTSSTGVGGHGGSSGQGGNGGNGGTGGVGGSVPFDAGDCHTTWAVLTPDPGVHVPLCLPIGYSTNPPSSGQHYPIWAQYKRYKSPVAHGFWVHDLEHGAIVVTYNCPGGCDAELAALEAMVAKLPVDPTCAPPVARRVVITPDPDLDTRFAASAWGKYIKSDCFDLDTLKAFYNAFYASAPENFCADGIDPNDPDSGVPVGCGK